MKRILSILLALLAIAIVLEYDFGRFGVTFDQARQYAAAKQLSEGNGLVKPFVNQEDLSKPLYEVHSEFPPALAIISSPFFKISDNIHVIHTLLSLLTQVLFFLLLWQLMKTLLGNRNWSIWHSLFLLFLALNGQLLLRGGTSDLICVILYLGSVMALLAYHKNERKARLLLLACFLNVLTLYFRYAYLPALLVIPVYFALSNFIFDKKYWRDVLNSTLSTVLFAMPVILHLYLINIQADHVGEKSGDWSVFYWENLVQASPFPFHSFFELFPILKALGYPSDYGYDRGYIYSNWLHSIFYLFSIVILFPLLRFYANQFKGVGQNEKVQFALYSSVYCLGLIGLIYLGSVSKPSTEVAYNWSWAKVFRYYILVTMVLQLSYFMVVRESKGWINKFGKLLLISSLFFSLVLKVYNYTANYFPFSFEHNTSILRSNDSLLNSYKLHKELIDQTDRTFVLVVTSENLKFFSMLEQMIQISNGTLLVQDGDINLEELYTSAPIDLFVLNEKSNVSDQLIATSGNTGGFVLNKTTLMPSR